MRRRTKCTGQEFEGGKAEDLVERWRVPNYALSLKRSVSSIILSNKDVLESSLNEDAKQQLEKLKQGLESAEEVLKVLNSAHGIVPVLMGIASKKIRRAAKAIHESINLLTLHMSLHNARNSSEEKDKKNSFIESCPCLYLFQLCF
ncbi:hypothetical protein R1flu_013729 [Riccia fluitans]|uniref:Aluminum-activated malate transporter n=1 Tax=Riccia fluitans TaxID=41844 RepID=A0ABD1YE30_9MARC